MASTFYVANRFINVEPVGNQAPDVDANLNGTQVVGGLLSLDTTAAYVKVVDYAWCDPDPGFADPFCGADIPADFMIFVY